MRWQHHYFEYSDGGHVRAKVQEVPVHPRLFIDYSGREPLKLPHEMYQDSKCNADRLRLSRSELRKVKRSDPEQYLESEDRMMERLRLNWSRSTFAEQAW
jgi:hypothetical protein